MTAIYIDADACPVREETYRVATRLNLPVLVVSNGSRPIRPPGLPNVRMVIVDATPDAADDWIAERITAVDVCITADIPLAARCLAKGARVLGPKGHAFTDNDIGSALALRDLMDELRQGGAVTGGPDAMTPKDRSRFLSKL
ncbi:MAG TPA: YaiI/YqxD family protein, partial [Acetobacteraceae bacterium]|nr:YaiI/YqxD family protein [Acetobacteraceae bacterium]